MIVTRVLSTMAMTALLSACTAQAATGDKVAPRSSQAQSKRSWSGPLNAKGLVGYVKQGPLTQLVIVPDLKFKNKASSTKQGGGAAPDSGQSSYRVPGNGWYFFEPVRMGTSAMLESQAGGTPSYARVTEARLDNGEVWRWRYAEAEQKVNCKAIGRFGLTNPDCKITYFQRPAAITSSAGLMLEARYLNDNPGSGYNSLIGLTVRDISSCASLADSCLARAPVILDIRARGSTAIPQ